VAKVLYIKRTPKKKFIIVDAGMNDLIRPALYGAYHKIVPLKRSPGHQVTRSQDKVDIVGPICESGDFLAKERLIAKVKEGNYLAVMSAGAYGFSMSSNYNSRLRAAEVMVVRNKALVIRKRESAPDLVRNEIIAGNLNKR
jgi:diaminopimelate decarboxylase